MATVLLGNKTRDFWKDVGKVNKTNTMLSNLADDVTGDETLVVIKLMNYIIQ